jgi:hypothetical protein
MFYLIRLRFLLYNFSRQLTSLINYSLIKIKKLLFFCSLIATHDDNLLYLILFWCYRHHDQLRTERGFISILSVLSVCTDREKTSGFCTEKICVIFLRVCADIYSGKWRTEREKNVYSIMINDMCCEITCRMNMLKVLTAEDLTKLFLLAHTE